MRELWDGATYREERYAAMALTRHRLYRAHQDPATLGLYRHLVVSGAWWDFVDSLASHNVGDLLAAHPAEVTPVVRDVGRRRRPVAAAHRDASASCTARTSTDVDLLRDALEANLEDSRHGREFFVRKALGWALRQHARVDPDWVRAFVAEHEDRLSGLSRREALKHL